MVWIVLDNECPGEPEMVFRGGTRSNCQDWITKQGKRPRAAAKVERGAYVIVGPKGTVEE